MKKRIELVAGVLVLLLAGGASYFVDRMALGYLTGQRRIPGRDFAGGAVRAGGAAPGFAFLGPTEPSEDPPGVRVRQPFESGREIGLARGDVITSVDGKTFRDGQKLFQYFVREKNARDVVELSVRAPDGATRRVSLVLTPFLRTPKDVGLPYRDVEFRSGSGFLLRGWFIPPPEASDGRALVFVHGAKSSRLQALEQGAAENAHRRGYGILVMDLSGRGASEGKYVTYTVNEREDVKAMIRFVAQEKGVDPSRVVVFGTSNGASSVIFAAAESGTARALALDAPFSDLWAEAGEMLESRGAGSWLRYPLAWAVRLRAGVDLAAVKPIDAITRVQAPVLLIHGDKDREVRPYHTERLLEARLKAGLPTERWVISGGEHGFDNYPPAREFWDRVLDFTDRALAAAERSHPTSE